MQFLSALEQFKLLWQHIWPPGGVLDVIKMRFTLIILISILFFALSALLNLAHANVFLRHYLMI